MFKILNFNIFFFFVGGGVIKMNIILGYENFVDIYWGSPQIRLYYGVNSMHFRAFSFYVNGTGFFFFGGGR